MEWTLCLIAVSLPVATALLLPATNISRVAIVSVALLFGLRYSYWRITSFPWFDFQVDIQWLWWFLVIVVEIAVLVEIGLFLCTITWLSCRRDEANVAEQRLRQTFNEHGPSILPTVDIFITTFNEGLEVLEKSILGTFRVDYPCFRVWVLDDGRRKWLRDYCQEVGAKYICRASNQGAKAGNINNALRQSTADLVMIQDADFICFRNALWRVVGLFDDFRVATVQTPQSFFNPDALQYNLGIFNAWGDEQSYFFQVVARGRDALGVAFCCGSCSIHRRSVLQSVGGFPTDSITEDILLTMMLCVQGWRTIYFEEPISVGLAAESLDSFFIQRKRWGRGGIQVAWLMLMRRGLTFIQRIFFFPYSWITQYSSRLFFQVIPIVFFAFGLAPLPNVDISSLLSFQVSFLLALCSAMMLLSNGHYLPIFSEAISLFNSFELAPEILASVVRPFGKGFAVTPKGFDSLVSVSNLYIRTLLPAAILLVLNVVILFQIIFSLGDSVSGSSQGMLMYGSIWCCMNIVLLVISLLLSVQRPQPRREHRMRIHRECKIIDLRGQEHKGLLVDLSVSGALCQFKTGLQHGVLECKTLLLDNGVKVPIRKLWKRNRDLVAFSFDDLPVATRQDIIGYLFCGDFRSAEQPLVVNPIQTLWLLGGLILNKRLRQP
jgi:cellulose synthase (UDP-forming)